MTEANQDMDSQAEETAEEVDSTETPEEAEEQAETAATEGNTEAAEEEIKEPTVEDLKEVIRNLEEGRVRQVAELENFKRRKTSEFQDRLKYAATPLAMELITGLDNLERALEQAKKETGNEQLSSFISGIEMVQKQFFDALKKNNIERQFPLGEKFDPNLHEAVGMVPSDEVEPDHVATVFQPGYVYFDRVIRPAMVQVAQKG